MKIPTSGELVITAAQKCGLCIIKERDMKNPVKGTCDLSVHQSGSVFRLFGGWHSIEIPLEIFFLFRLE